MARVMEVGGSAGKFDFGLREERHRAGETVSGALSANEDVDARSVTVALRFYQESPDYLEYQAEAGAPVVHQGALRRGESVDYSFELPADALPAQSSEHGRIGWRLSAKADQARRLDTVEQHPIEVEAGPRGSEGPLELVAAKGASKAGILIPVIGVVALGIGLATGGIGPIVIGALVLLAGLFVLVRGMARGRASEGWDVGATADSGAVRRGEELELVVRVGDPASGRELEAGAVCRQHYDVRIRRSDDPDRRETRTDTVHEEWVPIDGSQPEQEVVLAIPDEAPFSFSGSAVSYSWTVTVREQRRGADASASGRLQVLP